MLKIVLDPNAPASVRVRAAEYVMDQSAKGMEVEDIEARANPRVARQIVNLGIVGAGNS